MLSDIRRYLSSRSGMVSLYELSSHFDTDEVVMAGMLSHWIRKGRVIRVQSPCEQACGGCDKASEGEWFQWVVQERQAPALISVVCHPAEANESRV